MEQTTQEEPDILAVVKLYGEIGPDANINTPTCRSLLENAFALNPVAVLLVIDSPGGCPTTCSEISAYLRRTSRSTEVPVYAIVESIAASGGYWLACAADEIWIGSTSMCGCIGVIMMEFGVSRLLNKLEIEPWILTTGANKAGLTPFQERNPAAEAIEKENMQVLHNAFVDWVKSRRPQLAGLDNENSDVFSGRLFVGQVAIDKGLADRIATDIEEFVEDKFPDRSNMRIVEVRPKTASGFCGILRHLFGAVRGVSLALMDLFFSYT